MDNIYPPTDAAYGHQLHGRHGARARVMAEHGYASLNHPCLCSCGRLFVYERRLIEHVTVENANKVRIAGLRKRIAEVKATILCLRLEEASQRLCEQVIEPPTAEEVEQFVSYEP